MDYEFESDNLVEDFMEERIAIDPPKVDETKTLKKIIPIYLDLYDGDPLDEIADVMINHFFLKTDKEEIINLLKNENK